MKRLALPLIAALALTACSGGSQDNVTVMTTVNDAAEAPAGESAAPEATAGESPAPETTAEGDECANPDATIEDSGLYDNARTLTTQWGEYTAIPTDWSDFLFVFRPEGVNDFFDPCLPLSWAVIGGANGDERGPAGTGASVAAVVVFFHYDQLITDPVPSEITSIEDSSRIDDNTVQVLHGHAGRTTAEGVTEVFVVDHTWRDGRLVAEGPDAARYEAVAAETANLRP
ncbi:MAG: LppP/LprE family lipoprotein [Corynebacterium sp.]|uniref:LppP/LprE family lipoprotein n=1 Tax=Corynebacterium sp. TaxID=1720 RepID=UPI0026E0AFDC|nr:LppP/LprE family lipoprotein [Corynebacterium sp.]MDO5668376.1 LppP/LprE family lipoprotein [Corynebacterium sp.]